MKPNMDQFKKVDGTVSSVEQQIGLLLELQSKNTIADEEKIKLENFATNPVFKDEYQNATKDMDFGSLPEDVRVKLVREDIDKKILGEAA